MMRAEDDPLVVFVGVEVVLFRSDQANRNVPHQVPAPRQRMSAMKTNSWTLRMSTSRGSFPRATTLQIETCTLVNLTLLQDCKNLYSFTQLSMSDLTVF